MAANELDAEAHREHFDTSAALEEFRAVAGVEGSVVARFESAVDAVGRGDVELLRKLLKEDGELVYARSMRNHQSTLLIYVGANGVEGYRQGVPPNAEEVAEVILGYCRGSTSPEEPETFAWHTKSR